MRPDCSQTHCVQQDKIADRHNICAGKGLTVLPALQCIACRYDLGELLGRVKPQDYVRLLTATNVTELLDRIDVSGSADLEEAKAIARATADSLVKAENIAHNAVLCCVAAAIVQVPLCPHLPPFFSPPPP